MNNSNKNSNLLKNALLIFLALHLFNCSKDDDDNSQNTEQTTQELLIGKWYYSTTSNGDANTCEAQSYYHFTDNQNLDYQLVLEDMGLAVSGFELIGDCYFSNYPPVNYTLNEGDEIQYLGEYGETIRLKIASINQTTLVLTTGSLEDTQIYILTKNF